MLDISAVKKDFPIFKVFPDLVYLDSTATSLKPKAVINKIVEYYQNYSANIFRGVYQLSEKATLEYEKSREKVAQFINAKNKNEIVFVRNTTEAINLLAYSLGRKIINQDDEILTTIMEHHSNFVPWQVLATETGAKLKIIDVNEEGNLDVYSKTSYSLSKEKPKTKAVNLKNIITKKTKIFSLTYVSNVLGTVNPIKEIIEETKKINPQVYVIVDAAQAAPHLKINVQDLNCDFLAFSSHKMLGPTGVGVLYGKENLLKEIYPFLYGGEMISEVYLQKTVYKDPPYKFEAGTPAIGEVIGLQKSIDYLEKIGMEAIRHHEEEITKYALKTLKEEFDQEIKIFGPKNVQERGGIIAFNFSPLHPHDVAQILDEEKIAVRAGHHCAMPLHQRLQVPATIRASFYLYNDKKDVDRLVAGLKKVRSVLVKN